MEPCETVVLAYSGGLDTSCILKWLLERGHRVVCYMADVGQVEDFKAAKARALAVGASEVVIDDRRNDFVQHYVWPAVSMGLIYERRYLLGTSLARPCIAVGLVECARRRGARLVAHGATGKGNDQVRFELSCYAQEPELRVLAPWRMQEFTDRFQGRTDLVRYAQERSIPVAMEGSRVPWSMDANMMHVSYESGVLEDPAHEPPNDLYQVTTSPNAAPSQPERLDIHFKDGLPVSLLLRAESREISTSPTDIFRLLNEIGARHGVGRVDIVENRFVGLKSRGVYETPGAHVLHVAHLDLEVFCLDREVLRVKQLLADRMADYVYNGFWFSPESRLVRQCLELASKGVTGVVHLELYKGSVMVLGRRANVSLYNEDLVSMDRHADFTPADATGFINIHALRLKEDHRVQKEMLAKKQ